MTVFMRGILSRRGAKKAAESGSSVPILPTPESFMISQPKRWKTRMKLYGYPGAPNPRKVEIFLAEKAIDYEFVNVDLTKGEQRSEIFLQKNFLGKIPVLETDDGQHLNESTAICRYLEACQPAPSLFGTTPFEIGVIEMRNRHVELNLWMQIGIAWVNGPIVGRLGRFEQNPLALAQAEKAVRHVYTRFNEELAGPAFVAGSAFSMADVSLWIAIDFASRMVALKPDAQLLHLNGWFDRQSQRQSIARFATS